MRFPRHGQANDADDLEALQTDVMRFIAILGLCLAAIFSLVQTAAVERQTAPAQDRKSIVHPARVLDPVREVAVVSETTASPPVPETPTPALPSLAPDTTPPDQTPEFTLEFASSRVMQSLLESGQVQLYARVEEAFWSPDESGNFIVVDAPAAYYEMAAETVPVSLRSKLRAPGEPTWGVTLPTQTIEQVQGLMARQEAGRLLIQSRGEVTYRRHQE